MDLITTFLLSISPLGEARVGIPYGIVKGEPVVLAFLVGLGGNLLVFPVFYFLINLSNKYLWRIRAYKKAAVYLSKKAKRKTKSSIEKYGWWGLMVFVMIPLPVTGAYMGTLAAYILGMERGKSFTAISIGVMISSVLIAGGMYLATSL